ncbi:MAG: DNA helicase II, partial [Gammaproteobacteria bacterium]|nr:DNA helicase II [Gammaproteobacteria bacterium]
MDITHLIDSLNDSQREAVCAQPGPMLVVAGAGSGKTRVLVHRIAWLIQVEGISAYGILAVTFTNKAAGEMRSRIESLLKSPAGGMWVGTFHGLAHRILRAHWREAGLPQTFQILDSDDQQRMIKRVIRALELDEAHWPARQAQWYINARKDEGKRPGHIDDQGDPYIRTMVKIYQAYEEACERAGVVDFAELLLRAHELWLKHPDILKHYQQRFRHILVDEFQDTNAIQYAWLRLLAGEAGTLFVVGDDDQSIYGWRGAKIEHIQRFAQDYPRTTTIRLEQNYRSTGNILAAANAVISHNSERLGKELWTSSGDGEPIYLYRAFSEIDESRFVVERIQKWVDEGGSRNDCAVLYRSNAQSRVIEETLMMAGVPYRVYGGLRFFERAEIKDALAYLRLTSNRHDDPSFERVVNVPTRGIGNKSVEAIREQARAYNTSMWSAANRIVQEKMLPARATNAIKVFLELVEELAVATTTDMVLYEQVEHVRVNSGLIEHFKKEKGEKGQARLENLEELVNAARGFEYDDLGELSELDAFLAHAALEAGEGQADAWEECVHLMTLHSAKGLEFPLVFMVGVEEGLFPHQMSRDEPGRLEEERRLCYVGMTRAMQVLYLSCAEARRLHGSDTCRLY